MEQQKTAKKKGNYVVKYLGLLQGEKKEAVQIP